MLLLARFRSGPTSQGRVSIAVDRKRDAEPIIELSRTAIHFPGFRLKSTRSLAEGRFRPKIFIFFSSQSPAFPQGRLSKVQDFRKKV
jgi:hypothetical protein